MWSAFVPCPWISAHPLRHTLFHLFRIRSILSCRISRELLITLARKLFSQRLYQISEFLPTSQEGVGTWSIRTRERPGGLLKYSSRQAVWVVWPYGVVGEGRVTSQRGHSFMDYFCSGYMGVHSLGCPCLDHRRSNGKALAYIDLYRVEEMRQLSIRRPGLIAPFDFDRNNREA